MYAAKDMYEDLKIGGSKGGEIIDQWLKEKVLPNFDIESYNPPFVCPEGLSLSQAKNLLEVRGFMVDTTISLRGVLFIHLEIPSQSE